MVLRVVFLSILLIFFASLCWIFISLEVGDSLDFAAFWLFMLITLILAVLIAFNLIQYKRITLNSKSLIIARLFAPRSEFHWADLLEWQQASYFLRGRRRDSIMLFFSGKPNLFLSDRDQKKYFESLLKFLRLQFDELDTSSNRRVELERSLEIHPFQFLSLFSNEPQLRSWFISPEKSILTSLFDFRQGGKWKFSLFGVGGSVACQISFLKLETTLVVFQFSGSYSAVYRFALVSSDQGIRLRVLVQFPTQDDCEKHRRVVTAECERALKKLQELSSMK